MKRVSIVIPVYNEETILSVQVKRIISKLDSLPEPFIYEILLVENGSTDKTYAIGKQLQSLYKHVRVLQTEIPSYGQAFKEGILKSRYDVVAQFDIDFWDIRFLDRAMHLIDHYDVVIGSKNMSRSYDRRPFLRRLMSRFVELFINTYFGVKITDTHGLKVLRKNILIHQIPKVRLSNHFFDSELLIRAYKSRARFIELPVDLKEIRKTRFSFITRMSQVLKELIQLIMIRPYIP